MLCLIDGPLVMELLRDDGKALQPIHLVGIDNRANCPIALAIQYDSIRWHATFHQRIPHTHRFIDTIQTILIATNQDLLNLPCLIQLFSRIDAIYEKVVRNPIKSRLWSSAQQKPKLIIFYAVNIGENFALCIVHNYLVADHYNNDAHQRNDAYCP
jgi:hypothetical protein